MKHLTRELALLAALSVTACSSPKGLPSTVAARYYIDGAGAQFELHDLGTSGSFGFEDSANGFWIMASFVRDEQKIDLAVEQSTGASFRMIVGFDTNGLCIAGFGGRPFVLARFRRDADDSVDVVFEVRP